MKYTLQGYRIRGRNSNADAFTIVELLIVVVVIAILAAITIISYNGITQRATQSAATSEVSSAQKKLELLRVESGTDAYPDPSSTTISVGNGATVSYILPTQNMYCMTVTKNGVSNGAAKGQVAAPGSCVTNLVKNPKGIGGGGYATSGWFFPLGTTTDTANVSWGGRSDWHRFVWSGSGNGIMRLYVDETDLVDGATYTSSVLVANPGSSTFNVYMDFSDMNDTLFAIAPGEVRRIAVTGSRSDYTSIYRFIDVNSSNTSATGLLVTDAMLTRTNSATSYGDGSEPGWAWTGSAGLSKSTGPAQ